MAIAKTTTIAVDKKPELLRKQVLPAPKPVAVDTAYEMRSNLLQHISGSSWTVTYYKQIKTSEEASEAFNINRPAPYQQYLKIENFEIKVTTPLSNSPDNQTSSMQLMGVGLIYPSIVPDHGDTFIADIGDGRMGLFNIQEVTQKSHLHDTVYEIEYQVVNWLDHEDLKELDKKVIETRYYERYYANYGADPILNNEEHGIFDKITKWQCSVSKEYFRRFFNPETRTFLVPVKDKVIYDPFLVEFIRRIWSTDEVPEMNQLHVYNRDTDLHYYMCTIWDAIINNDIHLLRNVQINFSAVPKRLFRTGIASLMNLAYSRFDYIYYPVKISDRVHGDFELPNEGKISFGEEFPELPVGRTFTLTITKLPGLGFVHPELQQHVPIPDAKKYGSFDTYVLSDAFYKKDKKNMSKIELMLLSLLEGQSIDLNAFIAILNNSWDWGEVERFYYIPLLYAMSRAALGGMMR